MAKIFVLLMIFINSVPIGIELVKRSGFGKNLLKRIAEAGEKLFR